MKIKYFIFLLIVTVIGFGYQLPQAHSKSWLKSVTDKIKKHVPSPKIITKAIEKTGEGVKNTVTGSASAFVDLATLNNPKKNIDKAINGAKDTLVGTGETAWNSTRVAVHGGVATIDGTVQHLENDVIPNLEEKLCMGNENCINGGVSVDDDGEVILTDANGNKVEKPETSTQKENLSNNTNDQDKEALLTDFNIVLPCYNGYWPGVNSDFQLVPPNSTGEIRNDDKGYGFQFAPRVRNGIYYSHNGVDYKAKTGSSAYAPVPGKIVRISNAYQEKICYDPTYTKTKEFQLEQSLNLKCIVIANIKNNQYEAKVMYVSPHKDLKVGDTVEAGQVIGTVQSQDRPHIHLEIRDPNKKPLIIPTEKSENQPEDIG